MTSVPGATDILTLGPSHHGFLRYEGGLERFVERIVILKPFLREAAKCKIPCMIILFMFRANNVMT